MADETTISDYGTNAPPLFRVTEEGDQTVIRAYDTNYPLWRINGKIAGGVEVMTTAERIAITPDAGKLIYDSDLDLLFVGDGETAGGTAVGGGGGVDPGAAIFDENAATLAANTPLVACTYCDNQKNEYIELFCRFTGDFDSVTINHGSRYITVDSTKISYNGGGLDSYSHNLTITDFLHVIVYSRNEDSWLSTITIMTADGSYTIPNARYRSNDGAVSCTANIALSDVSLRYIVLDGKEDVWAFGDSYMSMVPPGDQSWPCAMMTAGHKNILFCAKGARTSVQEIQSFRNLMSVARPKVVVWCLGMNDVDTGGVLNADWKACVDEVIATCNASGVTPVIATIPNVPFRMNNLKNAYIATLGVRTFDQASAVCPDPTTSTWYPDMLREDQVHTTTLGSVALMNRFLTDVPEVLYAEEHQDSDGGFSTAGFGLDSSGSTVYVQRFSNIENLPNNKTLLAGHAYTAVVVTGTTIKAETCPSGQVGMDAHLSVYVSDPTLLHLGGAFGLRGELTADAVNNCRITFHDGASVLHVEDTFAGYVVTSGGTTGTGSLAYGLSTDTGKYISFNPDLNGSTVSFAGAVTSAEKHIVGNGSVTILGGTVTPGASLTLSHVGLADIVISGTTSATFADVELLGSTVTLSGSTFTMEVNGHIRGTGTIDLGNTIANFFSSGTYSVHGVTFAGNTTTCVFKINGATGNPTTLPVLELTNCVINCPAASDVANFGTLIATDCTFSGATNTSLGAFRITSGGGRWALGNLIRCTFVGNVVAFCAQNASRDVANVTDCTFGATDKIMGNGVVNFYGKNKFLSVGTSNAVKRLKSESILDLSGNTNTNVFTGTVIVEDGVSIVDVSGTTHTNVTGGTYTTLKNDGTLS